MSVYPSSVRFRPNLAVTGFVGELVRSPATLLDVCLDMYGTITLHFYPFVYVRVL